MTDPLLAAYLEHPDVPIAVLVGGVAVTGMVGRAVTFAEEAVPAMRTAAHVARAAMIDDGRSQEAIERYLKSMDDAAAALSGSAEAPPDPGEDEDVLTVYSAVILWGAPRTAVPAMRLRLSSIDAWWVPHTAPADEEE